MPPEQPIQHPISLGMKIWVHTQHNYAKQYN